MELLFYYSCVSLLQLILDSLLWIVCLFFNICFCYLTFLCIFYVLFWKDTGSWTEEVSRDRGHIEHLILSTYGNRFLFIVFFSGRICSDFSYYSVDGFKFFFNHSGPHSMCFTQPFAASKEKLPSDRFGNTCATSLIYYNAHCKERSYKYLNNDC